MEKMKWREFVRLDNGEDEVARVFRPDNGEDGEDEVARVCYAK